MRRHRPHPVLACLISLIWLLAAVLPTISYAKMMQVGQVNFLTDLPSQDVCSTTSQDGPASPKDGAKLHLDHCGMCLPHAGATGLPPNLPPLATPLPLKATAVPALFLQSPCPLFAWATPALRAPPQA